MNEEIFYSFKERVRVGRIIFSILLMGGGYAFYSIREKSVYWYIYAVFFSVTGIWLLSLNLKSYFGKAPGLYLGSDGLIVKTSVSTIDIKWKDIRSFQFIDKGAFSFVSVILFNNEKFLQQVNSYGRWTRKRMLKKYGTPIPIPISLYHVSKKELLEELNYRLEKYR